MENKEKMSKNQSFLKGATILAAAGVFIKILGAGFKLPLAGKIGAEGMSYFMAPYPIYMWLLVVATAGIPPAIARLIAEKNAAGDTHGIFKILKVIVKPMLVIGLVFSTALFFGAEKIANFVGIEESKYAFKTIAPALLLVPFMSILRGFFQGIQKMKPYAISQIVEQLFRVGFGLSLAFMLFGSGIEYSAAGATFGASIGAFFGLIIMYIMYREIKKTEFDHILKEADQNNSETDFDILKQLLVIAVPITIGATIMPTMNSIDLFLVVNRLNDIGIENSKELYGILTGFAVTIVNFPQILTASLQISLVPAIAQQFIEYTSDKYDKQKSKKQLSDTVNAGIKASLIIGLPSAIGLVTLGKPVMALIYSSQPESAIIGGGILEILGWDLIFLALFQSTTGILQGIKKQMMPAINLGIGMVFKIALTYILVGMVSINITGAAYSTIAAFAIASILNVVSLAKEEYLDINMFKISIKPIISVTVMGIFVKVGYKGLEPLLGSKISTVVVILMAAIIYITMILVTKSLDDHEYDMLPGGSKLKKLANKLRRV